MGDVGVAVGPPVWEGKRWTLKEKAVLCLRTSVLGEYEAGGPYGQGDLIDKERAAINCSPTPVREALSAVAAEGLIRLVPNKGVMIDKVGDAELKEILAITLAVETLAARELAEREEAELAGLESHQREMMGLADASSPQAKVRFVDLDVEFHCGLAREARCRNAETLLRTLRTRTRKNVALEQITSEKRHEVVGEHERILEALRSRDPGRIEEAIRSHVVSRARRWFQGHETYLQSLDFFAHSRRETDRSEGTRRDRKRRIGP